MKNLVFLLGLIALSVFGMGKKTSYSIDFKQNSQELKLLEKYYSTSFSKK